MAFLPSSRSGLCPSDWGLRCVRPQAVVSSLISANRLLVPMGHNGGS
ncbi:hypothetical protein [uncultured Porphyromonas sp.]|nr:hypothetical protein [uncultured Porphyromonas sp.]